MAAKKGHKKRDKKEVEKYWVNEPIGKFEKQLKEMGMLTESEKEAIWRGAEKEIKKAVEFGQKSPYPEPSDALTDLFIDDAGYDY